MDAHIEFLFILALVVLGLVVGLGLEILSWLQG